jgi:hypothetical protein
VVVKLSAVDLEYVGTAMEPFENQINLTLEVEDELPVRRPTLAVLFDAIERMKPSGPSFIIVNRDSGDYAQAGGGDGSFLVEWRVYGEPFIHLVAGKGVISEERVRVQMSLGYAEIFRHEVLSVDDVKALLGAFLLDGRCPEGYLWRNVTEDYICQLNPPTEEIYEL